MERENSQGPTAGRTFSSTHLTQPNPWASWLCFHIGGKAKESSFVRKEHLLTNGLPGSINFARCTRRWRIRILDYPCLHSLLKLYQSQPEGLCKWISLSQPSHVHIILLCSIEGFLRHCLSGLLSVSWKEGMKLNDLGKCMVWGKEVPVR